MEAPSAERSREDRAGLATRPLCVLLLASATLLLTFVLPQGPAHALAPPTPWNGVNPFHCTIQNAAQGTTVPNPGADPYCVQFDKTNQNVTQLGMVSFLLNEPARTAAAVPKCFYYQQDHWRGSLIQSDGSTVVYEFYGHYFFDKATGDGGVWVTGFTVAGRTFDPTTLPGFPPAYGEYFGPGTGGMISHDNIAADPACAAQAAQHPSSVYAASAGVPRCVATPGKVAARRLGPVVLGESERRVRAALGPPSSVERGWLHYCAVGGNQLLVGQPGDRSGSLGADGSAPTVIVLTTSHRFSLTGRGDHTVAVGSPAAALRRAFPHARRLLRIGRTIAFRVAAGTEIIGVRAARVRYIAVYERKAIRNLRALAGYVKRA